MSDAYQPGYEPANENDIDNNIKDSFKKCFRDDDRDGKLKILLDFFYLPTDVLCWRVMFQAKYSNTCLLEIESGYSVIIENELMYIYGF